MWFTKFGGRKFFGYLVLAVTILVLAKMGAPGDAYLALGGGYAAMVGANAVISKAAFNAAPDGLTYEAGD